MIANHLLSHFPTDVEGPYRKMQVWKKRPSAEDHIFDAIVNVIVAASSDGCVRNIKKIQRPKPRFKRRTMAERINRAG